MTNKQATGLQFPCDFQIKAMGVDDGGFQALVLEIVGRHCDRVQPNSLRSRLSSAGKYISVSLIIEADSRAQLDAIYDDLTADDRVLTRL